VFDEVAWDEDMTRASRAGRAAAAAVRGEYETAGVPIAALQACDPEGPGGTQLRRCVKVYVPAADRPHGMVFEITRDSSGRLRLAYAAFGLRHPPSQSRQPSVYEVAHRRLSSLATD
jgi:hypothetical protein